MFGRHRPEVGYWSLKRRPRTRHGGPSTSDMGRTQVALVRTRATSGICIAASPPRGATFCGVLSSGESLPVRQKVAQASRWNPRHTMGVAVSLPSVCPGRIALFRSFTCVCLDGRVMERYNGAPSPVPRGGVSLPPRGRDARALPWVPAPVPAHSGPSALGVGPCRDPNDMPLGPTRAPASYVQVPCRTPDPVFTTGDLLPPCEVRRRVT